MTQAAPEETIGHTRAHKTDAENRSGPSVVFATSWVRGVGFESFAVAPAFRCGFFKRFMVIFSTLNRDNWA